MPKLPGCIPPRQPLTGPIRQYLEERGYEIIAKPVSRKRESYTDRELATILAALRWFQHCQETSLFPSRINSHFDEHEPLTTRQIDALCERINQ